MNDHISLCCFVIRKYLGTISNQFKEKRERKLSFCSSHILFHIGIPKIWLHHKYQHKLSEA